LNSSPIDQIADPAKSLGLAFDIGSLEAGKLADIVFYPAGNNPLDDLTLAENVMWVMKGGLLYESPSLNMLYPSITPRGPLPRLNPLTVSEK